MRARRGLGARVSAGIERSTTVSEAARAAGIGRRTAYDRRARDEEFARAWDDTLESAIEQLEQEAVRRAKDGSDQLLMFLLRARRPAVYSERYRITHAHRIEERPEIVDVGDPEVRKKSREFLHAVADARARRLAEESNAEEGKRRSPTAAFWAACCRG